MNFTYPILFFTVIVLVALLVRIAKRSGVSDADLARKLPGDDLLPDANIMMDRAAVIGAPAHEVWRWVVQMGKDRGGWYVPAWLERFTRGSLLSGIRTIDPQFQQLRVGDLIPEYGPGSPSFKAITVQPPHTLVYLSLRDPAADWTWPRVENPLPKNSLAFSWALLLEEIDAAHCRFYIRFRGKRTGKVFSLLFFFMGGLFDYLTMVLMFAGLRERLSKENPK